MFTDVSEVIIALTMKIGKLHSDHTAQQSIRQPSSDSLP
jgi:hypothetical protein